MQRVVSDTTRYTWLGQTAAVQLRRAVEADRQALAEFAAPLQARPERHITYLGIDPSAIAAELVAEDDDWTAVTAVAEDAGRLVGWLMGSVDAHLGRVWWFGPFVDADDGAWRDVVDALWRSARGLLPAGVDQEELAPDSRYTLLADWAEAVGFDADPGSVVLTLEGALPAPTAVIRPLEPGDARAVADLHDLLFPGTHTTGEALARGADDAHVRLVADVDGSVAGYVAVERLPDDDGYIDFLGVAPGHRRRGLGGDLVRAGVGALDRLGCRRHHLTVREAESGARSLYAGLGFQEERTIRPFRRGFRLP